MPLAKDGTGTIEYLVSSVVLVPAHTEMPMPTPGNPMPEPVVVPNKVTATLTPINDLDPKVVASGSLIISTETITAFDVGDVYKLTIAPSGARKAGK